jgi:hypothetical protein
MIKIIDVILNQMAKVCKPQKKFMTNLMGGILATRGKLNFRNISRHGSFTEKTISRNYRKEFDFAEFNGLLIKQQLASESRKTAAFDPTFIAKSGKHTHGIASFWNGSAGHAEKGLEASLLSVIDVDSKSAYAISASQTPNLKKNPQKNCDSGDEETRIDAYLGHIIRDHKHLPAEVKHITVDAFFSKKKFVHGILQGTNLHVVGKLRIDANLRFPFAGQQSGKGRPKKFDGKFSLDDLSKLSHEGPTNDGKIQLYSGVLNSVSLEMSIKNVVAITEHKKRTCKAILFSTDLNLSALEIYQFYSSRFQIEFQFRDAKHFTGLDNCQARLESSLNFHFNASFMALNLSRFMYHSGDPGDPFSMSTIKSRCYNERLIESLFPMFDIDPTLIKDTPAYQKALNYGAIHV